MAKIALLIGVSEYKYGLNPLPGAIKDVEAMQRVLQHPKMGSFTPDDITVLKNPQRQVMEEAIEMLFSSCQKDDLLLLYFSGHGIKDDRGRLFLTTPVTRKNSKGKLIRTTTVAASLIHEVMETCRSKRQVIILDSCFSGAFAEGMRAKDDGIVDIKTQLGGEGRAILTSSTALEYSFEQEGSDLSIYTRYIVEGIETGAADADNNGVISVDELHDYAKKKVQEAAPAMNPGIFAVKEGYKIKLAKAPIGDPKLEYRKEVEKCIRHGKVSIVGRRILQRRQRELCLSAQQAQQIENEVLEPLRIKQQNLKEYEEAFREAVEQETTLSKLTREELKRFQELLRLRDEDIAAIHKPLDTAQSRDDSCEEEILCASTTQEIDKKSVSQEIQTHRANSPTEPEDLGSEKGIDYTKLRDLLAAQKWKEADYQTYLVMLEVLGKKDGHWFTSEEVLNFPFTDLQTIDKLWVIHSNGHFGFSVQKKIYLESGGKFDGSYCKGAWEEFCDRIRWTGIGNIQNHSNTIFITQFPQGHFPNGWRLACGYVWVQDGGYSNTLRLLSRIENCISLHTNNLQTVTTQEELSSEKGIDYTKLRDLLAAGKWKEADNETYLVMLQAVGRETKDWIRYEELLNFPCTDLRIIDHLWTKYSNGRFGFSAQKDIYLNFGGKPDGKYYEEVWKKFSDCVEWKVIGNWIINSNVTFNPSTPKGHLPLLVVVNFEGAYLVSALLSRIEACRVFAAASGQNTDETHEVAQGQVKQPEYHKSIEDIDETFSSQQENVSRKKKVTGAEEELDQILKIELTPDEMQKGLVKKVTTLENENINVGIPAAISPGKKLRLKGKGKLSSHSEKRGDLYLLIHQSEPSDDLTSEKGIDYTKLRDLLAAGKWEEADNETYLVMLRTVGRKTETGNFLRREELLNFPYADLCTIDHLWTKYSNGRFGFSAQKDIYLNFGGKPDGKYYEEVWKKFSDRVGWRAMGRSRIYSKATFNTPIPTGHLPLLVFINFEGAYLVSALLSRIEACKV